MQNLFNIAIFSHPFFFLSILFIIMSLLYHNISKLNLFSFSDGKKEKDLIWWAGLKGQVTGNEQYKDPLLPFPPEDENKVFEMLLYKEPKMPETSQNISQTCWILN
jgi:hypothetical protein